MLSFIRIIVLKNNSKYNINDNNFLVKVLSKEKKNEKFQIELLGKEKLISYIKDFPYDVGDILEIKGNLEIVNNNTIPNTFDYKKYLNSKGINYELKINNIILKNKNTNVLNKIKIKIKNRINGIEKSEYLYAFILGDSSHFNNELKNIIQNNGLSYLLSIGSFEIMSIVYIVNKLKKKLRFKEKYYILSLIMIFLIYFLLTKFKIGAIRCGLCYILNRILKYKKIKFDYSNIILIVGIIILLINPNYIYNIGFYYSFIISYGISLLKRNIKGSYIKRIFLLSFYANILSFPINIYLNYEVNFLSFLFGVILLPFINFIIYPLCILTFIFPFFNNILLFFISIFENFNSLFSNINLFYFVFRKPSILILILYYFVIIMLFRKKIFLLFFLLMIIIHLNINTIIKEKLITFLDVNQGDSIVIKINNNITLIDTGGSTYNNYSQNIVTYLHSLGISRINALVLTHGDFDHMGESINLVENIKIEKVIFNCGEFNNLEKDLIKVLNKKKIPYYSCVKELSIDNNKLYFLQTKEYDNENDNSNVIYTELEKYKFMFMGDASITTEKEIINKYNLSDIDVLKVGHHGSKTSSGKDFIDEINPNYSIISVGKNNKYHHPNKEVLNVLDNSKIYRTDEDGSIMFKIKNNKLKIKTYAP